jgi:hypothetical protein
MMHVKYTGGADIRQLATEDLEKVGLKAHKAVTFTKGDVVQVSDELGKALTDAKSKIFGKGEFTELSQADVNKLAASGSASDSDDEVIDDSDEKPASSK